MDTSWVPAGIGIALTILAAIIPLIVAIWFIVTLQAIKRNTAETASLLRTWLASGRATPPRVRQP